MAIYIERHVAEDGEVTTTMAILPSGKVLGVEGVEHRRKEIEGTIQDFGGVEGAMPWIEHMYSGIAVYGTDLYPIEDPQEARQIIQEAGLK